MSSRAAGDEKDARDKSGAARNVPRRAAGARGNFLPQRSQRERRCANIDSATTDLQVVSSYIEDEKVLNILVSTKWFYCCFVVFVLPIFCIIYS